VGRAPAFVTVVFEEVVKYNRTRKGVSTNPILINKKLRKHRFAAARVRSDPRQAGDVLAQPCLVPRMSQKPFASPWYTVGVLPLVR